MYLDVHCCTEHVTIVCMQFEIIKCLFTVVFLLVCRTKKLKQVMLVERRGLRMFCDLFTSAAPNGEIFTTAVESLVVLANDLEVKFPVDVADKEEEAPSNGLVEFTDCKSRDAQARNIGTSGELHQVKKLKVNSSDSQELLSTAVPTCLVNEQADSSSCPYNEKYPGAGHDIAYQMDNGDTVPAHKEVVKSASDVFAAMLSSRYVESTQCVIPISDVSAGVFEFAVHHIYGCKIVPCNEQIPGKVLSSASCSCEVLRRIVNELQRKGTSLQFFFELLSLSDRFMLDKLRTVCEKFLINFISTSTVVQICATGLQLNSPQLCVHCLSYLLNTKTSNLPTHLHLFKELFLCVERGDIVEHLYQLLLSRLKL